MNKIGGWEIDGEYSVFMPLQAVGLGNKNWLFGHLWDNFNKEWGCFYDTSQEKERGITAFYTECGKVACY